MAYLFQSLVIFAVVASNIHWQWTPNGYLAAGLGIALAYVLTRLALNNKQLVSALVQRDTPQRHGFSPHVRFQGQSGKYAPIEVFRF